MVFDVVCLSTADWDAELWTNKQHLMSRLNESGCRVLYVDSLGLRSPGLNGRDARRIANRLAKWRVFAREIRNGLYRDSPLVLPWNSSFAMGLNRLLVRWRLSRNIARFGLEQPMLWSYTPAAIDVFDSKVYSGLIYHCVDDLAAYPGIDRLTFESRERELIALADVCVASSRPLVAHLQSLGAREVVYWPNPADVAKFSKELPARRTIEHRPVLGFAGAVQEHKVDFALLCDVAILRPNWRIVLVGPVGIGLRNSSVNRASLPQNIEFRGPVSRDVLPSTFCEFDVALIPYRQNDYTRSVFPMKVFEYLAAGLGVVATSLPSLVGEVEFVSFADSAEDTVAEVERILTDGFDNSLRDERIAYASSHSWESRTDEALELIASVMAKAGRPSND